MTPPWPFKKPLLAARTSQKWSGNGMGVGGNHSGMLASEALKRVASRPKCPGHGLPGTVSRATNRLTAGVTCVVKCCATLSERRPVSGAGPARAKSARASAAPCRTS